MLRTNGVLGFCYSKQLCLCVIELHMGVNIQRHADVRMTHDILQCLGVHPGFFHIGTEGVPAQWSGYSAARPEYPNTSYCKSLSLHFPEATSIDQKSQTKGASNKVRQQTPKNLQPIV